MGRERLGDLPAASLGDPALDVAAVLGAACFLCAHRIHDLNAPSVVFFGPAGDLMPQLPAHGNCMTGHSPAFIAAEYRRRIHDLAGVRRPS